jgi:predicted nuclease of predicted toxin-antitoxin system
MRFLVDECCDAGVVDALRGDGHNVLYATKSLRGATDDELLTCAVSEERILLTEDKDFGELVYRLRRTAHGIVLLRFDVKVQNPGIIFWLLASDIRFIKGFRHYAILALEAFQLMIEAVNILHKSSEIHRAVSLSGGTPSSR